MEIKDETQTATTETSSASPSPASKHTGSKKKTVKAKTKKTASAKAGGKKTKKAASSQAQTAGVIELPFDKMNKDERKIVKAVYTPKGDRKPWTIKEIMKETGLKSSPVRNAVRRPVRSRWLEHTVLKTENGQKGRGVYRLTDVARKRGIPKGA